MSKISRRALQEGYMIVGAVMVPHPPLAVHEVGRGEEFKIQDTLDSYHSAMQFIADLKPETVVIISPHAIMYRDYFNVSSGRHAYGDFGRFRAGGVAFDVTYDELFTNTLTKLCEEHDFPAGTQYDRDKMLDHGVMVPLYFLDQHYSGYQVVRIGLSGFPLAMHYQLGMYIKQVSEALNRRTVIIGSGDLSHCQKEDGPYGYKPEGPQYDMQIMGTMGHARFGELLEYDPVLLERSEECGHRSFVMMAGALDGTAVIPHAYSHEATFGVGYGIVTYEPAGEDMTRHFLDAYMKKEQERIMQKTAEQDPYVSLARIQVREWVTKRNRIDVPDGLPSEMLERQAGVFVSIHEHGDLRGCIGTIAPTRDNIAKEIIYNAISACSKDPRFTPIREDELPYLDISVDVLGETEPVLDRSQLDVKRYGVICSKGYQRGLLLPVPAIRQTRRRLPRGDTAHRPAAKNKQRENKLL